MTSHRPRPGLSRRRFLALGATGIVVACSNNSQDPGPDPQANSTESADPFTLGVASGDPLPDSVILWTRLAPEPLDGGGMDDDDVEVHWEVARDEAFNDVAASGTAVATPGSAHSVHVDASGLEPASRYWYRFSTGEWQSPIGRTRTAPDPGSSPERLRLSFASCQHREDGLYAAWANLAEEDLDLVLFLGDYIYEDGPSEGAIRQHNSAEVESLEDYRNRYALYKSDVALQAAHAATAWVITWDDHEVDDNYFGAEDKDGSPTEEVLLRRAAAYQAWYEHQPVRLAPPEGPDLRIYRTIDWGDLARFPVLDTRQYRDPRVCPGADLSPMCDEAADEVRTFLGAGQHEWLSEQIRQSPATWTVLAQSLLMYPMRIGSGENYLVNHDQWDGYPASRQKVLDDMAASDQTNNLVLTGDFHASAVADLRADPEDGDSPIVASEFLGTSISSELDPDLADAAERIVETLEDVHWSDFRRRGYVTVELTPETAVVDYRLLESASSADEMVSEASSWRVEAGSPGVRRN